MGITWLQDAQYWKVTKDDESYFDEVAYLRSVCWLHASLQYKGIICVIV